MDFEIKEAIEDAYRIEREYGFLQDYQSRMIATFTAIRRLAETEDASVINGCPDWMLSEMQEWVQRYRQTGEFGFISNLGSVDHSVFMAKANAVLLNIIAQPGSQADGLQ